MKRISYLLTCLLGISIGLLIGRRMSGPAEIKEIEVSRTDTLIVETVKIVIDTQYIPKPIPYEVRDTILLRDTIKEPLLLGIKRYTDNKTYDMQVSGIDVQLDWIKTFTKTEYRDVVKTEQIYIQPKKWNLYAEVTISIMETVNSLNIGGGISYTKDRWMIDAQVGREVLRGNNYVTVGGRYNFARF